MSDEAIEQSIDVIRRSESDNRSKAQEIVALRQKLAEAQLEIEKLKTQLRRCEIRCEGLVSDNDKKQCAIDIILKEMGAKKHLLEQTLAENTRLKRDIEVAARHSGEISVSLKNRSTLAAEMCKEMDSPASLYMRYCFSVGTEPNMEILRSLATSTTISCIHHPASYQQLSALIEVFHQREQVQSSGWPVYDALEVACESQDCFQVVAELAAEIPSLRCAKFVGVGDYAASALISVLGTPSQISSISLPQLCVSDAALTTLMKTINSRGEESPVSISELDLSCCSIAERNTFWSIRNSSLCTLNVSNCAQLHDNELGEILKSCPNLATLSVAGCTSLTNEAVLYINSASLLTSLNVKGCSGITSLKLAHIEVLTTDLGGVLFVECPVLKSFSEPILHFQCISWFTPQLHSATFQNVALHQRELSLLSESAASLSSLSLLNCRVQQLEILLRKMRRLIFLSLHSSKGVVDDDILAICGTVEILDLTGCFCLTDKAVSRIAEACHALRELTLKRCSNITDAGILQLEKCQQLDYLNVLGAKKVSTLALHKLVSIAPTIHYIAHETLVSASIQVDRDDEEEAQKALLQTEERSIACRREQIAVNCSASPRRSSPRVPPPQREENDTPERKQS